MKKKIHVCVKRYINVIYNIACGGATIFHTFLTPFARHSYPFLKNVPKLWSFDPSCFDQLIMSLCLHMNNR